MLPRHARCVLCRLRCNVLLSSYLTGIDRIKNPSCSNCGHSSQDTSHLILHCSATDFLSRSVFGNSLSFEDLWSRPWRVAWLLGLLHLPLCSHPTEGCGHNNNSSSRNNKNPTLILFNQKKLVAPPKKNVKNKRVPENHNLNLA